MTDDPVKSVEDLKKDLSELDRKIASVGASGNRIARKAVNAGIKVLEAAQKTAAPVGKPRKIRGQVVAPGALRAAIKSRGVKAKYPTAKSGIEVTQKPGKGTAPHGHLIAAGTDDRYTGSKGVFAGKGKPRKLKATGKARLFRGAVTPNPFIKNASISSQQQIMTTVVKVASEELKKLGE